jgi:hypothetical protein
MPTHTKQVSFRFTPEVRRALDAIRERDGVPLSEQMRRAVRLWIDSKHITLSEAPVPPRRSRRG